MEIQKRVRTILILVVFFSTSVSIIARDSPFTKHGAGPKYWIAYEYCWVNDTAIPEARWKANIDWMSDTFKSFGYDLFCNDGWIEAAQTINSEGYITKYNDDWEHGFQYWSDYLAERDMKLGVYYNPMWMTKAAFEKNVTVDKTKIKSKDIVGSISFNDALYWVDVDKEGSKEWIQGYVKYFINLGAKYLRIDFLENYEKNYGTAKYIKALKWIEEAAGDEIFLSLVMPNCFDHGRNELTYGDMIRIDDDCFAGGWDFVSGRRRGEQKALWPQFGNAFDGFIGFADIGGRGQMILDGDFIRLNTMANDKERIFIVSLMIMGGSALAIADQYDTIGSSAWVYQNREMLDLNDQGFVAKPLSYNAKDIDKSSTWAGQLPNGDWVVGFFNREETNQVRSIDFNRELGISSGSVLSVRDLWAHADLGNMAGGYSVELEPHECRVIKIKNNELKYEAEFASMISGARKGFLNFQHSGAAYVENLKDVGSKVLFAVEVPSKGEYILKARYANPNNESASASLYVNDKKETKQLVMRSLKTESDWESVASKVVLEKGLNYISIQKDKEDKGNFSLDYIQIIK